jgi:hypothetical protein
VNGGEFVDATIALVETKSKGSLTLMGPNGGITKPSGWQPQGTEIDGRLIGLQLPTKRSLCSFTRSKTERRKKKV